MFFLIDALSVFSYAKSHKKALFFFSKYIHFRILLCSMGKMCELDLLNFENPVVPKSGKRGGGGGGKNLKSEKMEFVLWDPLAWMVVAVTLAAVKKREMKKRNPHKKISNSWFKWAVRKIPTQRKTTCKKVWRKQNGTLFSLPPSGLGLAVW